MAPGNRLLLRLMNPLLLTLLLVAAIPASAEKPGVAVHLDELEHMNRALRQIERQREAAPGLPIHVIMVAGAVHALIDGSKDENGGLFSAQLEQLLAQDIRLFACLNTLDAFNKTEDDLSLGVETVRSGVAALTDRQLNDGFAYIKL
ncbi:hypothetical signal peptide protein [Luminiphilus syltensis NOR5-1B]|uniref:Hypothetical signal peptide protein n=1 Tax=Luminiphilus syltensis NOR5-1B TaxID=565045 RepID=B8KX42_9GAMM|nr:DsrE family protein [Luminiphilus syltensis]EED34172.1 hypothetical signal peptide protein [Luminiphilus syltensis NOR5-1B]